MATITSVLAGTGSAGPAGTSQEVRGHMGEPRTPRRAPRTHLSPSGPRAAPGPRGGSAGLCQAAVPWASRAMPRAAAGGGWLCPAALQGDAMGSAALTAPAPSRTPSSYLGHHPAAAAGPCSHPGSCSRSSRHRPGSARRPPSGCRSRPCCHRPPPPLPAGDSGGRSAGTGILLPELPRRDPAVHPHTPGTHLGAGGVGEEEGVQLEAQRAAPALREEPRAAQPPVQQAPGGDTEGTRWARPPPQHGARRYAHPHPSPNSPTVPDELVRHRRRRVRAGHALIHKDSEGQARVGGHRRLDVDQLAQHHGGQGQAGGPGPWGQAAVGACCHPRLLQGPRAAALTVIRVQGEAQASPVGDGGAEGDPGGLHGP